MKKQSDKNEVESQLQQQLIQIILQNRNPDGNDVAPDEMQQLIFYLERRFLFFDGELDEIPWQILIHWIDLLPDIHGVDVHKIWGVQKPMNIWECFWWRIVGAPRCWQFEIQVQAQIPWGYAVVDTLDTARKVAQEAYEKFKPY